MQPEQSSQSQSAEQMTNQAPRPTNSHRSKLWIWLVAIGIPVLAGMGILLYLLVPKGSPAAWCETEYKMANDPNNLAFIMGSTGDKKAALSKYREYLKKMQIAAPDQIRKDVNIYVTYSNESLDAEEKRLNTGDANVSSSRFRDQTAEESAATRAISEYTRKTCGENGKVKKN